VCPVSETQRVIDAFTEMAPHYEQTVDRELQEFWGLSYRGFIELLLDRLDLEHAEMVLDVATGRAEVPLALGRRTEWRGRAVGVDITPGMLRGAEDRVAENGEDGRVRLTCGSGMQLPFVSASFDTALCALATHHMKLPGLLAEMRRVLRPGGQLLVADVALASLWCSPAGRRLLRILAWWYTRRESATRSAAEVESLANMRTPDQWRDEVAAAGFIDLRAVALPARRRWYPPGILITARAAAE
jgi:ubiquinone/menaquinone biosynthesis C-methylase UbiE